MAATLALLALLTSPAAALNCGTLTACPTCAAASSCEWTSCQGAVPACTPKAQRPSGCSVVPCGKPALPCAKQHFLNGTNVVGSDLSHVSNGPDPALCCAKCEGTPGCKGWTLLNEYCYLKSASSPVAPMAGAISGTGNDTPSKWTLGCGAKPQSTMLFCNPKLPLNARVADLMSRLHPAEKMAMLRAANPSIPRVGLGSYDWDTEVLHGIFSGAVLRPLSCDPGSDPGSNSGSNGGPMGSLAQLTATSRKTSRQTRRFSRTGSASLRRSIRI